VVLVFFPNMKQLTLCILYVLSITSGKVEDSTKVQTLLFSATLPSWVKNVRPFQIFVAIFNVLSFIVCCYVHFLSICC